MIPIRAWWFTAVLGVALVNSALADQASDILAQVAGNYVGGRAFSLAFEQFSALAPGGGVDARAAKLAIPGMKTIVHPDSGMELFSEFEGQITLDGGDGLRVVKQRRIQHAPTGGAKARNFDLWNSSEMVHYSETSGDTVTLIPLGDVTPSGVRSKRQHGEMTPDRLRGEYSILHLVRWSLEALGDAKDLSASKIAPGLILVRSQTAGFGLTVDEQTFEARLLEYRHPNGDVYEWRWEGALPVTAYPARHPERVFHRVRNAASGGVAPSFDYGDVFLFSPMEPQPDAGKNSFDWRSVAPFAHDRKRDVVIDTNGKVNDERTSQRKRFSGFQSAAVVPTNGPAGTTPSGSVANAEKATPWWLVGSVACVLCGGALVWRKAKAAQA